MGSRRRSGGRGGRKGFYWDGLQWPLTNVGTGGAALVLVDTTAQEFMPATLVTIRGFMSMSCSDTDAATAGVTVGAKIMYVEVNDAQTMTGDHAALDTHEEDIAQRQLWTYHNRLQAAGANLDAGDIHTVEIEINVKVKIKLEPHGKKLVVLLLDASSNSRLQSVGYLRAGLVHG